MKRMSFTKPILTLALVIAPLAARAESFYGLSQNTLFSFDSVTPGAVSTAIPITGLGTDSLVGIDLRPATGQLYGLGSSLRLYVINPTTGLATAASSTPFGTATGTSFGFDFNPSVDAARVVNESAQNFRVSPNGTAISSDVPLAYAVNDPNFGIDPSVVAIGYGTGLFGNPGITLAGIDSSTDAVILIPTPNDGTLKTVGLLGVNTTSRAAFDVSGLSGNIFASLTKPGDPTSGFYSIDRVTGAASLVGQIGFGSPLDGLTASSVPEPSTWALLSCGALGLLWRSRKRKA